MLKKLSLALIATTTNLLAMDITNVESSSVPTEQTIEWKTGVQRDSLRGFRKVRQTEVWQGPRVSTVVTVSWADASGANNASMTMTWLKSLTQFWTPDNKLPQITEADVYAAKIVDQDQLAHKVLGWKLEAQNLVNGYTTYSDAAKASLVGRFNLTIDTVSATIQPTVVTSKEEAKLEKIDKEAKRIGGQFQVAWEEAKAKAKAARDAHA